MNQRGFIFGLSPLMFAAAAAGLVIVGLALALRVQSSRLESEQERHAATQAKFDAFVSDTKRIGLEAQKRADEQKAKDQKAKEKADHETNDLRTKLAAADKQLRHDRAGAGRNILPPSGSGAKRPDLACFDRSQLDAALQRFIFTVGEGAAGLTLEGDKGIIDLNAARRWAQEPR